MNSENVKKERPHRSSADVKYMDKQLELIRKFDWKKHKSVQWFIDNDWEYEYHTGLVDKTEHYTRIEEDTIIFKNYRYIIQVNTCSLCVVLMYNKDYDSAYGVPTVFLPIDELKMLNNLLLVLDLIKRTVVEKN